MKLAAPKLFEHRLLRRALRQAREDRHRADRDEPSASTACAGTYASIRCACGDDVAYASAQLGHEDPHFTLKVYAQATNRRERLSGPHLKARSSGAFGERMMGLEPTTFCMASLSARRSVPRPAA